MSMYSVPNDDEEPSCLGSDGSKKPRSDPILLTPEQEEDVVSWYQDHPLLYNKGLREYKDTVYQHGRREIGNY